MTDVNNEVLVSTQQFAINDARRDGTLFSIIASYFQQEQGIVTRQELLLVVRDELDLTEAEANAMHLCDSGSKRNYVASVVDYMLLDIKNGLYGEHIDLSNDGTGTWILDGVIDISKSLRFNTKVQARTVNAQKELKIIYKAELVVEYSLLDVSKKAEFNKRGGNMQLCITRMFDELVSANQVISDVIA